MCIVSCRPPLLDSNPVKRLKTTSVESPRQFFIGHLLNHRGSLWGHSLEEAVIPQWERCVEYFDLLCNLLHEAKCKCCFMCVLTLYQYYARMTNMLHILAMTLYQYATYSSNFTNIIMLHILVMTLYQYAT
jgi:hypothetical protein